MTEREDGERKKAQRGEDGAERCAGSLRHVRLSVVQRADHVVYGGRSGSFCLRFSTPSVLSVRFPSGPIEDIFFSFSNDAGDYNLVNGM